MRSRIRLFIPLLIALAFCIISSSPRSASTKTRTTERAAPQSGQQPAAENHAHDPLCGAKIAHRGDVASMFGAPGGALDAGEFAQMLAPKTGRAKALVLPHGERVETIEFEPEAGEPLIFGLPEDDLLTKALSTLRVPGQTFTVHVGGSDGVSFEPSEVVIQVGDTVQWVWDSPNHTVTGGSSCVSNGSFNSSGPTFSRTFNAPGNILYYCSVHCSSFGMAGVVNVQGTASTFTISGKVTTNGTTALSGVTMTLSGAQSATTTTNASGDYSFSNLATGNYTVTPSLANHTFTPANRTYTNLSANQTSQNFTGTPPSSAFTISGQVKLGTTGLAAVTMTLTSPTPAGFTPRTVQTNSTGNYTFADVPGGRNYTLTPSKSGHTFTPANRTYTNLSANQTLQNFAATATTTSFTIRGLEKLGCTARSGVTMTLTSPTPAGFAPRTVLTTATGAFSFTNVPGGRNYTLTPTKTGYTFKNTSNTTQSFRSYTNLSANQTNQNFAATATATGFTISGFVKVGTAALSGVTMKLVSTTAGFTPRTLTTTTTGAFSFTNVPGGRSYTLTPTKTNYTFTPVSKSYANLSANQTNQNFAATLKTYTISGRVTQGSTTTGLAAVTMTLSSPTPAGFPARTVQTNSNGGFSFTGVPAARNYTLKPTKTGFTFNPVSRSYTNLSANQTGAATSFAGTPTAPRQGSVRFSETSYVAGEGDGHFAVTVIRTGDVSAPAAIDYSAEDRTASERSDYSTALGTLRFAAGEASRSFNIFLTDDAYAEGDETVRLTLGNATGGEERGSLSEAELTIKDNDNAASSANPVDDQAFFVRQLYIDFLAREPAPEELFRLVNSLNRCGAGDLTCDRAQVFADLLRSEEFQQRGYFIYRLYKASLGREPLYREFIRDMRQLEGASSDELMVSQEAFLDEWMNRSEFKDKYGALSDREFAERLWQTAGMSLTAGDARSDDLERVSLSRSQALREMIFSVELSEKVDRSAYVNMLYFGYLRRNPYAGVTGTPMELMKPDPQGDRKAVQSFIASAEYRSRFGQP